MLYLLPFIGLSAFLLLSPRFFGVHKGLSYPLFRLRLPTKADFLEFHKCALRIFSQGLGMLKYLVQSDVRVSFLWVQGLIIWVFCFYSWMLNAELSYRVLGYASILLCVLAIFFSSSVIEADLPDNLKRQ